MNTPTEKPKIVDPLSREWFKTVSFGDLLKIAFFVGAIVMGYTQIKSDLAHETEMRHSLETRTAEGVADIRRIQGENSARTEQRFAENSARDRELLSSITARMDRIENKIDLLMRRPFSNQDH